MPTSVRLRDARPADLPALLAMEAGFPGDRLSARQFRHHLGNPRACLRVAEAGGVVLGYLLLLMRRGSGLARLYSIAVDESGRGLRLEVRQDNAAANALYLAAGYRRLVALPAYYDDGADGWRYGREIPGHDLRPTAP